VRRLREEVGQMVISVTVTMEELIYIVALIWVYASAKK
jgi:hypothetical protein